jgi:transcriptional regulator with GAF, ATPase, and Fis domain
VKDPSDLDATRAVAFAAVNTAFASLGRICMGLDSRFRIRHASQRVDSLLGPGAATQIVGQPVEAVLGPELFGSGGPLKQALEAGEMREGWRAVLHVPGGGTRLVSVTAAPLQHDAQGVCDPEAKYILVLRPADDEPADVSGPTAGFGVIWRSQGMARVLRLIETLEHSESTVLVTGESGTGKEVIARMIHAHSPRRTGPFVAVNIAALPSELLESELFGHVRGAFTGAMKDRVGRFESAAAGTLFLDEVGELPLRLQVKLLRVLQERTYERVGDNETRETQARIIAATNRDLRAAVADGTYREDLFYRLRVFPIELPPLRARREDIEPIARLLLSRVGARTGRALHFSPDALRALLSYDWPGNVRELENALEFGATVSRGQTLQPEDLPAEVCASTAARSEGWAGAAAPKAAAARAESLAPAASHDERARIEAALDAHRWNRAETSQALGLSRSTLWRRMRELGLAREVPARSRLAWKA